ncbi:MAG: recombinase family protein, partial [Gemmobacter sp.]|nr:recombinase family protein [Gemmobacter sp.]
LVWNRHSFVKNPGTGTRVTRIKPESEWIRAEVPHLRIVDDALWRKVQERRRAISAHYIPNVAASREAQAKRLHLTNRPVTLLSGLIFCGCCGGRVNMVMTGRYACRNHLRNGLCSNGHTIRRDEMEARVLAGLRDKLVSAEAVAAAVRAYAKEMNRLNHDRRAQSEADRRVLQKIERAVAGIMAAIEDGFYQPSMKARMSELEREKAEILARLAEAPAALPDIHPNIANVYRKNVERFTEALNDPDGGREAAEALRSLIGEIVLTPGKKRGEVHAELRGEFMGILAFAAAGKGKKSAVVMPPVASAA